MQMKGTTDKPWMAEEKPSAAVVLAGGGQGCPRLFAVCFLEG